MTQPSHKIAHAVEAGLTYALGFESPLTAAADFIAVVKRSQNWSEEETWEIGQGIVAGLAQRFEARKAA